MKIEYRIENVTIMSFLNGLVFFSPVALLVRTQAGITVSQFFLLQAILSVAIFIFEIPTGKFTDKIGYKNTLVLSEIVLCLARILLFVAFLRKSMVLFVLEAIVEGIAACYTSGTQSAYLYCVVSEEKFMTMNAHISKAGTMGFLVSTISYAFIYRYFGIRGLLIATIMTSFLGILASVGIPKEPRRKEKDTALQTFKLTHLLKRSAFPKSMFIIILSGCISISFILINFFYVDKLQVCGLEAEWLTPIILGYSLIELCSERILELTKDKKYKTMLAFGLVFAGGNMIFFGMVKSVFFVIAEMLFLPLVVELPAFYLDKMQNAFVDELGQDEKRAEILSVFNMGVNFIEIIFLFASSYVAELGISFCFVVIGICTIILGLFSYRN